MSRAGSVDTPLARSRRYALGDRADAPVEAPVGTLDAAALPRPSGPPTNPSRVTGAALDRRRKAGGWAADVFKARAAFEVRYQADAGDLLAAAPPVYAPLALDFGQRDSAAGRGAGAMEIG